MCAPPGAAGPRVLRQLERLLIICQAAQAARAVQQRALLQLCQGSCNARSSICRECGTAYVQGVSIPGNELIAVFDADQVAKREVRTLDGVHMLAMWGCCVNGFARLLMRAAAQPCYLFVC